MMESQPTDRITRWGLAYGVEPRLRAAFATPHGQKVLTWFEKEKLEPDVLAFVLIMLVWPVQAVRAMKGPSPSIWKEGATRCRKTAQWLRTYGEACDVFDVGQITTKLDWCAASLEHGLIPVCVGNLSIGMSLWYVRSRSRRDVARQQAIGLLIGFFKTFTEGRHSEFAEHPPWKPITDFLIMAKLIPSNATRKHVASMWSNLKARGPDAMRKRAEQTGKQDPPFENYQAELITCFYQEKNKVDGEGELDKEKSRLLFEKIAHCLRRSS